MSRYRRMTIIQVMENIKELYAAEEIRQMEKRINHIRRVLLITAAIVTAICVLICCLTNTGNSDRTEYAVIALTIGAGWVILYIRRFILAESRYELSHARMLRDSERDTLSGMVTVSEEKLRIKNSIPFRHVTVEADGKSSRINVIEMKAEELKNAGKDLELTVANGYVAGYRKL